MLRRLTVRGFRALKDFTLDLATGHPTVLIGPNATGKTTVLEAIQFLTSVSEANGQLNQALKHHQEGQLTWRGQDNPILFALEFGPLDLPLREPLVQVSLRYEFSLQLQVAGVRIIDESLVAIRSDQEQISLLTRGVGVPAQVHFGASTPDGRDAPPWGPLPHQLLLYLALSTSDFVYLEPARQELASLVVYPGFRPRPSWLNGAGLRLAPGDQISHVERIAPDGHDLFNALHTLRQEHPARWEELRRDFAACFQVEMDFRLPRAARGQMQLEWYDLRARTQAPLYLGDMSAGMLNFLCQLASLHAPDSPSLLAFDEPELHHHPHMLRRLMAVMEHQAERTSILVVTHSSQLLDFLDDPAQSLRVIQFEDDRGAFCDPLEPEALSLWLESFTASQLRSRGLLDRQPEPPLDQVRAALLRGVD